MKGLRKASVKKAKEAFLKSLSYSYRDRRNRKRDFRRLWIQRLSAFSKQNGLTYSAFIKGLKDKNIEIDRKTLSELAIREPGTAKAIMERLKK